MAHEAIRPVILSGGAGTRLWPLSRRALPKQFHALISARSMIQETALRTAPDHEGFLPPMVLAGAAHGELIASQLGEISVPLHQMILEPAARNTAPAAAAAAMIAAQDDPGALLALLPADHAMSDAEAFRAALRKGAPLAAQGRIVTLGVTPDRPETGFGYIRGGEKLGEGARAIRSFEEKPDLATAQAYLASGDHVWNAGIFLFRADVLVSEMQTHRPDIIEAVSRAVAQSSRDGRATALGPDAFSACPAESLDYAIMEHTDKGAGIGGDAGARQRGQCGRARRERAGRLPQCARALRRADGHRHRHA